MSEFNTQVRRPVPQGQQNNAPKLKIIPLGGVEEIGINCTVFEYKNKIMVVDMGLGFPDADMYGVDFLVPNVDYLVKHKQNIEGIIITHGHLDHIGALPYLLPRLEFPDVYGTEFTIELIKAGLKDHNLLGQAKLHVITPESVLRTNEFEVKFFRVNHSIPQAVGVYIKTPAAKVVHTGDFKFDNSPINEPVADYAKIANIGEEGVDLLLADSTNSLKKGHPISETDVAISLESIIERAKGRVVVAAFSGLVGRLYQLIQIAEKLNRKVAIGGYSMNQTLRIAEEIGYIRPRPDIVVPIQKINRYNDDRVLILSTGSQGESNAALSKMAAKDYKSVQLKKGDTVILSAGTIPGNNSAVQTLIENITSKGAMVHQSAEMDFFTSGHGFQEDQKIMLNLVKPKFFMPVHGYQYFLREHARTAMQVGIKESNIIIPKRGALIEGSGATGFTQTPFLKAVPLLVSGAGVGDIGASVLEERKQLGNYGVVVIDMNIDRNSRQLLSEPHVYTKGFIYVRTSMDLITEIGKLASDTITKKLKKTLEIAELRTELEERIGEFVEKETGRLPAILPMISLLNMNQKLLKPIVQTNVQQQAQPINGQPHPAQQPKQHQPRPDGGQPHQGPRPQRRPGNGMPYRDRRNRRGNKPNNGSLPPINPQAQPPQPQVNPQVPVNTPAHSPAPANTRVLTPEKKEFADKWNIPVDSLDLVK